MFYARKTFVNVLTKVGAQIETAWKFYGNIWEI